MQPIDFKRRRTDGLPQADAASAPAGFEPGRRPAALRLAGVCVRTALGLAVTVTLLLFFVLCSIAPSGAGEA